MCRLAHSSRVASGFFSYRGDPVEGSSFVPTSSNPLYLGGMKHLAYEKSSDSQKWV